MKSLTLIRHAKSDHPAGPVADRDRSLAARGRSDAGRIAPVLASLFPAPDAMLASPATRVVETIAALREGGAPVPTEDAVEYHDALYLADAEEIVDFAASALLEFHDVWLVAHNPGITEAVERIAGARLENVPTLGIARIAFEEIAVEHPSGSLVFFDTPRAHRHS